MNAQFRRLLRGLVALAMVTAGCRNSSPDRSTITSSSRIAEITEGGSLVGSVRAEPRSFNRYAINGQTEETIAFLTQAKLFRINRVTDEIEPWLAESWEEVSRQSSVASRQSGTSNPQSRIPNPESPIPNPDPQSPAGPVYRVKLRDITFSDGVPFTSADVLFAFEAIYDRQTPSGLADSLRVNGQPLKVRAIGDREVEIAYPAPYGPGIRMLDTLWVLPKHKLEAALRAGTLGRAWGLTTSPADVAGLGPFVLREYRPGERMVFERNPRYWRRDSSGRKLPYLDRLTLEILPDQTAELLRLEAGQLDFTHSEVRSEDYLSLKRAQEQQRVRLVDLGIALDADPLWFNLKAADGHHEAAGGKPWLRAVEFRRAVSLAVDRKAYADAVFLGAATPVHGPVTPGNTKWYWPNLPGGEYDPLRAKSLLSGLGLTDRNGDGKLEDGKGQAVRFTILLQRGLAPVERGAAFIREALAKVGVGVDVVGLDAGAVQARWSKGDYDAVFHRLISSDTDPLSNIDFWLSSGSAHVWNPEQPSPVTEWEKQIDALMRQQATIEDQAERVRLFRQAQEIFSNQLPVLYFAAPRLFLATSTRVANAAPSRVRPLILWSADTLALAR